ncbi:MAG TPA: CBS domain-containing protein [Bacteroidales bacterium]|nr:CBS domain-containing protein [Bacteroidales bacterium]
MNAYSVIESEMKRILDLKYHRRFFEMIDRAARLNPVIERYRFDLKQYGELRNAIVHDRSGGEVIAEPNDSVVAAIEHVARLLVEPPRVIPAFRKDVLTLSAGDSVSKAIREMSKHSYTQAPIMKGDDLLGLLTSNMIVEWMGLSMAGNLYDLENTTLGDIFRLVGNKGNYQVVAEDKSLFDIPDLFYHCQIEGHKLDAVLITQTGGVNEPFLGIITNRDLSHAVQLISQNYRKKKKDSS